MKGAATTATGREYIAAGVRYLPNLAADRGQGLLQMLGGKRGRGVIDLRYGN
jgi:hypothetical protein